VHFPTERQALPSNSSAERQHQRASLPMVTSPPGAKLYQLNRRNNRQHKGSSPYRQASVANKGQHQRASAAHKGQHQRRAKSPIVTRSSICLEAPKSASLTRPALSTRMLAPLMSRCMMWFLCKYSKPSRIWRQYTFTMVSLKAPEGNHNNNKIITTTGVSANCSCQVSTRCALAP